MNERLFKPYLFKFIVPYHCNLKQMKAKFGVKLKNFGPPFDVQKFFLTSF